MNLKRPVPLWLFIVSLLLVSSVTAGLLILPRFLVQPNFAIYVSPSSAAVRPEPLPSSPNFGDANASESLIVVKSMNGFTGSVSLSVSSRKLQCYGRCYGWLPIALFHPSSIFTRHQHKCQSNLSLDHTRLIDRVDDCNFEPQRVFWQPESLRNTPVD